MAIGTTPVQGLPYPLASEYLKDVNDHIRNLAKSVELKIVMVFASQTDLAAKLTGATAPTEGMLAWLQDSNLLQIYDGTAWQRLAVGGAAIYSGTGAPTSSLGAPGDVYIQQ